ncbi:MAG: ATP-binding cassette domain-containing protein [Bacteroidetes bacterium]|nr:ATP-binding cassette domain-containing protein [Bacteroidota bacterium]
MGDQQIIEVSKLYKTFGRTTVVNNLSFHVMQGDIYGFLGPNGAGKSTTLRMLVSLIKPDSGVISIFGKDLNKNRPEIMRSCGILIERPDFYKYLNAIDNLKVISNSGGLPVSRKRIHEVIEMVGLTGHEHKKVKTYSQGMKQRLGLAQALLHNPDLLLLDEPSNGLDPQGIREMRELIVSLNKDHSKTILLSSHLLYEIELMANRMLIINKGASVVEGDVFELLNQGIYRVNFNVSDVIKAKELLSRITNEPITTDQATQTITATLSNHQIPVANQLLVEHQIDVLAIKPLRALEEYFLSLT